MDDFQGSNFKQIGPITLGSMTPEARDLLDRLVTKFEKEHGKSVLDVSGYFTLYWACRWSGLIQPSNPKEGVN